MFGVELEYLLRREAGSDHIPPGSVPIIIEQCLSAVEANGLTEVGICTQFYFFSGIETNIKLTLFFYLADRIAGATTEINALRDAYNKGEFPIRETTDIHAICDLVKSWFRLLPEPVFPASSYFEVMEAMSE